MKLVIITLLTVLFGLVALLWLGARFLLSGEDHSQYDTPLPAFKSALAGESEAHKVVVEEMSQGPEMAPGDAEALAAMRAFMDDRGQSFAIESTIVPVTVAGIPGEWVLAPNADPNHRMLYLHGGGYVMGSARSHRRITDKLAHISGASVLAIDYALMPEHRRMDGIEDCRKAYRWLLTNGPEGSGEASQLYLAGDSAGGNIALSLLAWARDNSLRSVDAAIVMSPPTDGTYGSPTLVSNIETDVMQGKAFGPVVKAPKVLSLWVSFIMNKINPSDPVVSPLLGNLANLPPTLLQVSEAEMFKGEVIRYANKASSQGSTAVVQTWPHMVHVWHAFAVPEADEAFDEMAKFLQAHTGS